ncbi:hypothetical protein LJ656_19010 [Paraburkholderia sp. MMS20-SJTR3]|uniref:Uncharacterized protein n=1 Tax=Paraburkholderia sejongensis TaxID=2886946 RepID=A0ABS8JXQ0_9BURK|nr:hypothetical protein [Paraburkholderia sp. MMS20-SJTR3]MCC8394687.1 hypothetical protein [Paraburkholderia sp. MMS20-SJTR3]
MKHPMRRGYPQFGDWSTLIARGWRKERSYQCCIAKRGLEISAICIASLTGVARARVGFAFDSLLRPVVFSKDDG